MPTNGQQIAQEMPGDVVSPDPSIDRSICFNTHLLVRDYKRDVNNYIE